MNVPRKKSPKNPVSGWVVLDKPEGLTSTQALGRVRGALNAGKAGHGGTLDPFATGVLPIALGEATKLVSCVLEGDKIYRFTIKWGAARDTDDLTGRIIQTSSARPTRAAIEALLPRFTGTIQQIPPRYSALHVEGERAYDLAREGVEINLPPRAVRIDRFTLTAMPGADEAGFEVACGKGAYIRALARDLGAALGCFGHVGALKRLKSGVFRLEQAVEMEKLLAKAEDFRQKTPAPEELRAFVLPLAAALDDIPAVLVSEHEARRLRQGQDVPLHPLRLDARMRQGPVVAAKDALGLVALVRVEWDHVRPVRVFNVQT